jgi:hypothetical protein
MAKSSSGFKKKDRLLALKKWVPLREAAKHVGEILKTDFQEQDVLRLALDNHLTLSVRFINRTAAYAGREVPIRDFRVQPLDPQLPIPRQVAFRKQGQDLVGNPDERAERH